VTSLTNEIVTTKRGASLETIMLKIAALGLGAYGVVQLTPDYNKLTGANVQTFCSPNGTVINVDYPKIWNKVEPLFDHCKTVEVYTKQYFKHPIKKQIKVRIPDSRNFGEALQRGAQSIVETWTGPVPLNENAKLKFTIPGTGIVGDFFNGYVFNTDITIGDFNKINGTRYATEAIMEIQQKIQSNATKYIFEPSNNSYDLRLNSSNINAMAKQELDIAVENHREEISQLNQENDRIMSEERQDRERQDRETRPVFMDL